MVRAGAMEVALSGRTQGGGRTQLLQGHGAKAGNLSLPLPSNPSHYQAQEVRGLESLAVHSISLLGPKTRHKRADCASVQKASRGQPAEKTALTEMGTTNFR